MSDIELVIKIPEEEYRWITKSDETVFANIASKECMLHAIKNGTPIPKGHSSLIDRQETLDAIIKRLGISSEKYLLESERAIYQQIMAMSPIIEADNGNKDAAELYCNERGIKYEDLTEDNLDDIASRELEENEYDEDFEQ